MPKLQGNVLREYEQKFAEHLEQKLTKLCSTAGFSKNIEKGQILIALDDDAALDEMKGSCREYTLRRSGESSRVRGWIRGKHEDRPSSGCGSLLSSFTFRCGKPLFLKCCALVSEAKAFACGKLSQCFQASAAQRSLAAIEKPKQKYRDRRHGDRCHAHWCT